MREVPHLASDHASTTRRGGQDGAARGHTRLELSPALADAIGRALSTKPPPAPSWWDRIKDASGLIALVITAGWGLFMYFTVNAPRGAVDQKSAEVALTTSELQLQHLEGTPLEVNSRSIPWSRRASAARAR